VATGARPRRCPGLEPDKKLVWTYFEAWCPDRMPKSLLVVGSGAIGIEFASFFRTMGAEVTVVEVLPQVLPVEDHEIAASPASASRSRASRSTPSQGDEARQGADDVTATIELKGGKTETLKVDRVIAAVGVVGNIEGLGLEELGVKTERGIIVADPFGRTKRRRASTRSATSPARPMLAHKAEHEGVICVEAIKGLHPHAMDKLKDPRAAPIATRRSPRSV
jgi:dihydrolipoamide dehydrogenase